MAKEIKIQLVLDDKQIEAKILNADKLISAVRKNAQTTSGAFKDWATITTGINQGLELVQNTIGKLSQSVMEGAGLGVLRENFRGSAEDLELFRKATANTVSEANLIKLSNQATDLGVSLEDQAKLFALAEDAGDKYGVGVEESFQQVVLASEGNIRGLKNLGIQKELFEQTVKDLAEAEGQLIDKMDAEEQKRIRLQAIIQLSGVTLDDVKNKTQDNKDALEALGVMVDESKQEFGLLVSKGLRPFIDVMNETGDAGKIVIGSFVGITDLVIPLIPLITTLANSQLMLKIQSYAAATAMDTEAVSAGAATVATSSFITVMKTAGKVLGVVGIAIGLAEGLDAISEELVGIAAFDQTVAFKNFVIGQKNVIENNTNMFEGFKDISDIARFGQGSIFKVFQATDQSTESTKQLGDTVEDVEKKISSLQLEIKKLVVGSDEWKNKNLEIIRLQESISFKKPEAGKETFTPGFFDEDLMAGQQEAIDEFFAQEEERAIQERERLIELQELKNSIFEEDKTRAEEEIFQNEMIYFSREELLNRQAELEQKSFDLSNQLRDAETADQVENLKKQKQITDGRIKNIKDEIKAREEFTKQSIMAGIQQYDASRSLAQQIKETIRDRIKAIIAEAVATQIAKVISTIPFPFNIIAAPVAGLAVAALMEKMIPQFETGGMILGKRHSTGGVMVNAEGGEFIVNRESTRSNIELLEAINAGRNISVQGMGNNRDVVNAIDRLGNRIEKLEVVAKLYPKEFDEGITDYNLRKEYTGG